MKKFKKTFLMIVFLFTFTLSAVATTESPDFEETKTVNSYEAALAEKEKQILNVEKLNLKLEGCKYVDYNSNIQEIKENFDTIIKENAEETKTIKEEKEEEGYQVTVNVKEHDATTSTYRFDVTNNVIVLGTKNEVVSLNYNGKDITEVVTSFKNVNNDDTRIVITTTSSSEDINETSINTTENEAKALVNKLKSQGYNASYIQNNTNITSTTKTSKQELTSSQIESELIEAGKELKDVIISTKSIPSTYTSTKFNDKKAAIKEYNDKIEKGIYETVVINDLIDITSTNKISEQTKFDWNKQSTDSYTEDVYTGTVKTGYKYFYNKVEEVTPAFSLTKENLTENECNNYLTDYSQATGYTSKCDKKTNVTITESNNKLVFNEEKQTTRTWSHLDISVNQKINIIDENGEVLASNIIGTLSNIGAKLNNTTSIEYNSPTTDDGRLEVRQKTNHSNYTKVTNNDSVQITATLTYTYNNVKYTKNIVLEGYLNNSFNVCKEKNKIGGGFDIAFDINATEDGKIIINITKEESWTFTTSKPAVTKLQGYYDEYEYTKQYQVVASDEDYVYNVSYLLTNYSVSYTGTKALYNIIEKVYDKYFLINGTRTRYNVTTTGIIKEDDSCGTGGEDVYFGDLIINYITEDGQTLSKKSEYHQLQGTTYSTTKKSFSGYKLVKVEGTTTGEYLPNETIEVTYIYKKIPSVNTGIEENNIYEELLIISSLSFIALIIIKKRMFN